MERTIVTEETLLVTGGAGFIGSNFVRHAIALDRSVITLDALTYAGNRANLAPFMDDARHTFVEGSIADQSTVTRIIAEHRPSAIVNFAAESHVDRSIDGPAAFIQSNIVGVFVLLEAARDYLNTAQDFDRDAFRFLHVSTDEVYGSIENDAATEKSPYAPSSPYAASKASADHLVRAWNHTYGLPTLITNCSNNYGPYQFPEKLIPLMIAKALRSEPLPVYGDGRHERDWLHVLDHCRALTAVLDHGRPGETYNIASGETRSNRDVVEDICRIMDRLSPRSDRSPHAAHIQSVQDRPGHDRRYALSAAKLEADLKWCPEMNFSRGLEETIAWYLDNREWVDGVQPHYAGERLGRAD
jgi:dTDP-glucose 4,6-dehydratase